MNLQNNYEAIYEKVAEAIKAGQYKMAYEKTGHIYGSVSGIPAEGDYCFTKPVKVFVEDVQPEPVAVKEDTVPVITEEPAVVAKEAPVATRAKRTRKTVPVVEEPVVEEQATVEE